MRMLDAYKAVLRELDKVESPDFDPDDFTYWFRVTIDEYVKENYMEGDVTQKNLDDIRVLLSDPNTEFTQDGTDKTKFAIPSDYLHPLNIEVTGKALNDYRRWKKNAIQRFELRRQRTNRKGTGVRNGYDEANEDNPQFRIIGSFVYVLLGEAFEPVKLFAWYIKKATDVTLGPEDSDYDDEQYNTTLQFPDTVVFELIKRCKIAVEENIESPRLNTSIGLQQMKKE
jgi:hypothetical protein